MPATVYIEGIHHEVRSAEITGFRFMVTFEGRTAGGQVLGIEPQSDQSRDDVLRRELRRLAQVLEAAAQSPKALIVGQKPQAQP